MKTHLIWALCLNLFFANAFAAPTAEELMVNSYLAEQASKRMDQFAPRGEYTLEIKSTLKPQPTDQKVMLPFARSPINLNEIAGRAPNTVDTLLPRIQKLEINLSVSQDVPASVRALMKSALESQFALRMDLGDQLNVTDLPKDFGQAWTTPAQKVVTKEIPWKTILAVVAGLGICILLLGAIIQRVFSRHSASIAGSLQSAAEKFQDQGPSFGGGSMASLSASGASANPTVPQFGSGNGSASETADEFWGGHSPEVLHQFIVDLCESPVYGPITPYILNAEFPAALSEKVRSLLPGSIAEGTLDEDTPTPEAAMIRSVFKKYVSQYRTLSKSSLGNSVVQLGIRQLAQFVGKRTEMEALLLVSHLGPIRKQEMIRMLPADSKIKLARHTAKIKGTESFAELEPALIAAMVSIKPKFEISGVKSSLEQISKALLTANTFEEDETLYHQLKAVPNLHYKSVLHALDFLGAEGWDRFPLQDLAQAFSGYSSSVQSEVIAKFSGKRQQWLKSFFEKAIAQGLELNHPLIQKSQGAVLMIIETERQAMTKSAQANEASGDHEQAA